MVKGGKQSNNYQPQHQPNVLNHVMDNTTYWMKTIRDQVQSKTRFY